MTDQPAKPPATAPVASGGESWWRTLPGILTALAGLLTAAGGLVLTLNQAGVIGTKAAATGEQSPSAKAADAAPPGGQPARPDAADDARSDDTAAPQSSTPPAPAAPGIGAYAISMADGSTLRFKPDTLRHAATGEIVQLANGQVVPIAKIAQLDLSDYNASAGRIRAAIRMVDGQTTQGLLAAGSSIDAFIGETSIGPATARIDQLQSMRRVRLLRDIPIRRVDEAVNIKVAPVGR